MWTEIQLCFDADLKVDEVERIKQALPYDLKRNLITIIYIGHPNEDKIKK